MKRSALVAAPLLAALMYFALPDEHRYSQKIESWNQHSIKPSVVTEISDHVKLLNSANQAAEIQSFLSAISSDLNLTSLNGKDKERICWLYKNYSMERPFRQCQKDIILSGFDQEDVKAWIRVVKRQLKANASKETDRSLLEDAGGVYSRWMSGVDSTSNESLLGALRKTLDDSVLDVNDRYQVAKTLLQYKFDERHAIATLENIIDSSDAEQLVSRSYFILAKHYLGEDDHENAARLYSEYISVFRDKPDYEFFVTKAYQRVLQIQLESGNIASIHDAKSELSDFVSDATDLRSYFDTARKLVYAGLSREALSIFELGLQRLEESGARNLSFYQEVRLYVEVVRAGNAVGVDYEIQDKYIRVVDQKLRFGLNDQIHDSRELSYLYSQYLLWAAEAYAIHQNHELSEAYYGRFVLQYSDSPDYEYAVYKLLEVCSLRIRCHEEGYIRVTAPDESGQMLPRDVGAFSDLAAVVTKPAWRGEIEKWLDLAG